MKRYRVSLFKLAPEDCRASASVSKGKVLSEPGPRNAASAALINKQKDR
jgi:hypothetical protein